MATDIYARITEVEQFPIDRETAQERLDLDSRSRTSLFPWRGQFSPELIEHLLSEYAVSGSVVADPFVGSGTTLFECARKSLTVLVRKSTLPLCRWQAPSILSPCNLLNAASPCGQRKR